MTEYVASANPVRPWYTIHRSDCGKLKRAMMGRARHDAVPVPCGNCLPVCDLEAVPVERAPAPPKAKIPERNIDKRMLTRVRAHETTRLSHMWAEPAHSTLPRRKHD